MVHVHVINICGIYDEWIWQLEAQCRSPFILLCTEPSIGASYQISVHLATRFQRRRYFRNNKKKELSVAAMFVNGSGQNEQSL